MPRFDGTGPGGQGCKTGRGAGKCRGNNLPGQQADTGDMQDSRRGPGSGRGQGTGRGTGRGSGKGNNARGANWQ